MEINKDQRSRSVDDFIRSALYQAKDDAINLGQIAFWGRSQLQLKDSDLLHFVEIIVVALLEKGASIVRPVQENGKYEWEIIPKYNIEDKKEIFRELVVDSNYFHSDHDFIAWFSFNAREN